jgi:hypothetical protein
LRTTLFLNGKFFNGQVPLSEGQLTERKAGRHCIEGPGHTSVRPGRADRFLAPKSEGERDLVSPGIVAAGCRRPDGLGEGKVKLAETPA